MCVLPTRSLATGEAGVGCAGSWLPVGASNPSPPWRMPGVAMKHQPWSFLASWDGQSQGAERVGARRRRVMKEHVAGGVNRG